MHSSTMRIRVRSGPIYPINDDTMEQFEIAVHRIAEAIKAFRLVSKRSMSSARMCARNVFIITCDPNGTNERNQDQTTATTANAIVINTKIAAVVKHTNNKQRATDKTTHRPKMPKEAHEKKTGSALAKCQTSSMMTVEQAVKYATIECMFVQTVCWRRVARRRYTQFRLSLILFCSTEITRRMYVVCAQPVPLETFQLHPFRPISFRWCWCAGWSAFSDSVEVSLFFSSSVAQIIKYFNKH